MEENIIEIILLENCAGQDAQEVMDWPHTNYC